MRRISTDVQISAEPADVWAVLTDFARYPEWNPFIVAASGDLAPGAHLSLKLRQVSGRHLVITPKVVAAEPGALLRWRGKLWVRGVFDGEHTFRLTPREGGTHLEQSETFGGVLVPVLSTVVRQTVGRFNDLNEALKSRVEADAWRSAPQT
ncbi:SRPBCC family protein [Streptomyces sp. NPDC055189]